MCTKRLLFVLLIVVLVLPALAITPFAGAQEGPKPEAVGLRPDAPPYALHGPYWVGTRDFVIEDPDRPLPSTVWYPALNPTGVEETHIYTDIIIKWDAGIPADITPTEMGHALQDAAPDMSGGPYPLAIVSPGYGDFRPEYAHLTEHLASYGFVVIVPDHIEFWTPDVPNLWKDTIERPRDIQHVIAYSETMNGADGTLPGLIDMQRIAVLGHSYGGYTALATGGARLDLDEYSARCNALPQDDPWRGWCDLLLTHDADMATLAGLDAVPQGLWPSWGDPRVKAIVSFAGDSYPFGESGLKEITIPLMAIGGTADTSTPPDWGIYPAYENVSSSQKALVVFENADHFIFTATCENEPWLVESGWSVFCLDSVWDKTRAHDLLHHFVTAFLLATLKGETEAAAALAPDAVSFPGITYEAQGF